MSLDCAISFDCLSNVAILQFKILARIVKIPYRQLELIMNLFLISCGFVLVVIALLGAWREYLNTLVKKSEHLMNAKLAEIEAEKLKFMMEMQAARGALEVHREVQDEAKH